MKHSYFRCRQSLLWIVLHKTVNKSNFFLCCEARKYLLPFFSLTVRESDDDDVVVLCSSFDMKRNVRMKNDQRNFFTVGLKLLKLFSIALPFYFDINKSIAKISTQHLISPYLIVIGQIFDFRPISSARRAKRSNDKC